MTLAVRTIYHVDDDPDFLEEVRAALSPQYNVRSFADPRQLRKAIRGEAPDLLLLDLEMPGLTGHELLLRLRASAQTEDIPVIFLTGRRDRADRMRGLERGLDDYICKPPDMEELALRMENMLRRRPRRDAQVLARLHMERYDEACAGGFEKQASLILARAATMMRLTAGPACSVRVAGSAANFSGSCPDPGRAARIAALFNRILAAKGPLLTARNGYLEETPAPVLRFEPVRFRE